VTVELLIWLGRSNQTKGQLHGPLGKLGVWFEQRLDPKDSRMSICFELGGWKKSQVQGRLEELEFYFEQRLVQKWG
jgi:hypothetical protein